MKPGPRLTILPSVPVWTEGEQVVFDRKFYDGMVAYANAWPGPLRCVVSTTTGALPAFGAVRRMPAELPFDLVLLAPGTSVAGGHLEGSAVVLAAADDHAQLHVGELCRKLGAKCVWGIEYIPETRHQIVAIEAPNILVRLRRELFLRRTERRRRAAFAQADGLQANGTPAFDEYRSTRSAMLYFDTRTAADMLIDVAALDARLAALAAGAPLRLAFSGRLIGMKGADHLVRVAAGLRQARVPFHLTIYGSGELEDALRAEVATQGLGDCVELPGAVDFAERLIPEIKAQVDLYVMLHRQSDPSCTYLETLACGIPIVGYDNRALTGILRLADVGTAVPMDDVAGVVTAITRLAADRATLVRQSRAALAFAREHTFEATVQRRIDHLRAVAGAAGT